MATYRPTVLQVFAGSATETLRKTFTYKDGLTAAPTGIAPVTIGAAGSYKPSDWQSRVLGSDMSTGIQLVLDYYA